MWPSLAASATSAYLTVRLGPAAALPVLSSPCFAGIIQVGGLFMHLAYVVNTYKARHI